MRFLTIAMLVVISSCGDARRPGTKEIETAVGKYSLNLRFTDTQLSEKYKNDHLVLYVFEDLTFEIKGNKKFCFTNIKGSWSMYFDLEREYYVFELSGVKSKSTGMEVWVKCDTAKGVLRFGGISDRKPF